MASGASLRKVLEALCQLVERSFAGTHCSILLVSEDGGHLRHGAAPSLPDGYCRLIDGIAIAPGLGSCGTAAFARKPVVVTDIASDPLWRGYEEIARSFGLAACASTPVLAGPGGELLGTFAIYHTTAGAFAERELVLLHSLSDLAAIAILSHRREQTLQQCQTVLARLEALSEAVEVLVGLDGRWLRVPAALSRKIGRTEEEMRETRFQEILHPEDLEADRAQYARLSRGEIESFQTESRLIGREGDSTWVSMSLALVRDRIGAPSHLHARIRDITERKRAEEQLRAAQRMQNVGMLAGGLAHDFNNLLTAIVCSINVAQLESNPQSTAGVMLSSAETAARQAARMSRRMLTLAVPGGNGLRVVDLNEIVRESARILEGSFCRGIPMELDLTPGELLTAGDPLDLQQLLMNLAINAAQAIGDRASGKIRISTRLEDLDEQDLRGRFVDQPLTVGSHVVLEVADNGCGMTPETTRRIFDPFYTTKATGRGLGLAVVRGILRKHAAAYEVTSEVGRGTSFRFLFPAAEATPARQLPPPSRPYWPSARGLALLVENSPEVRRIVVAVLTAYGFAVREMSDGQSALLELAKVGEEVTLVMLDSASPRANAALRSMRERWPELHVVVTTAGNDGPTIEDVVSDEHVVVLEKPYGRLDLKRAVFGEAEPASPDEGPLQCPGCGHGTLVPTSRRITVDRGEVYEVPVPAAECSSCGKMFAADAAHERLTHSQRTPRDPLPSSV
jgi:PAS domain S-box-containing protein